jgi:hypothetical protein
MRLVFDAFPTPNLTGQSMDTVPGGFCLLETSTVLSKADEPLLANQGSAKTR